MIRGLYTSGWSMMANSKQMDTISNNLANINTNAYKKDAVIIESFPSALARRINDRGSNVNPSGKIGSMQLGSDVGEVFTYYNQGQLASTGKSLDFAVQNSDKAFFTVGVPGSNGNLTEYYTRDGAFNIDSNKRLVTKDGFPVIGENGPITLEGENFSVLDDGAVVQDGKTIDKLLIKEFSDTRTLRKIGSNLVGKTQDTKEQAFSGVVKQGFLEQSNVNTVKEMVDMINVMRSYEANQKVLQAQNDTLDKLVNQVGQLR